MGNKYKQGEIVYFISSNGTVEEATVVMTIAGFVTIRFTNRNWGDRVREDRLYRSRDEAEAALK